jgi:hypothetical protein
VTGWVVVDGHSASGKSTVAAILAERLGARLVRPFTEEAAAELLGYARDGAFDRLALRGREILRQAERPVEGRAAVFDRHWVSLLVQLPEAARAGWAAPPRTYLCWADAAVTVRRLRARVDHEPDLPYHARLVDAYRAVAGQLGVPLIDTSRRTAEETAAVVLDDLARRPGR